MPLEIVQTSDPKIVEAHLTGKLVKEDYLRFVPAMEALIKEHGKLRLFVEMHDFRGWTGGAVWEDVKFDMKHFTDIERIAMVGETQWQHNMAVFCKPFTSAKVRYFDHSQLEEARRWVGEGVGVLTA